MRDSSFKRELSKGVAAPWRSFLTVLLVALSFQVPSTTAFVSPSTHRLLCNPSPSLLGVEFRQSRLSALPSVDVEVLRIMSDQAVSGVGSSKVIDTVSRVGTMAVGTVAIGLAVFFILWFLGITLFGKFFFSMVDKFIQIFEEKYPERYAELKEKSDDGRKKAGEEFELDVDFGSDLDLEDPLFGFANLLLMMDILAEEDEEISRAILEEVLTESFGPDMAGQISDGFLSGVIREMRDEK